MDQFVGVAAQFDARRGLTEKLAPRLTHAVQALGIELRLQAAGLGLGLNAHGLGVEHAVHQVGVKDRAEHDVGIGVGQVLPAQRIRILDAADVGREHPVGACGAQVHAQVGAVQFRQPAGKRRHVRAGRIAALQHQRQHGGVGGRFPPRREPQVDRDAAAVEFGSVQRGDVYAGCELFSFQIVLPFHKKTDTGIIALVPAKVNRPGKKSAAARRRSMQKLYFFAQSIDATPVYGCMIEDGNNAKRRRAPPTKAAEGKKFLWKGT